MPITQTKNEYKANTDLVREGAELPSSMSCKSLIGTWKNVNSQTDSLLRLVIAQSGSNNMTVECFGACAPTPCNWGSMPAMNYAANVTGNSAIAFSAMYTFAFKQTIVMGRLHEGPDACQLLTVEILDQFTDGSGRSNYCSRCDMTRV